MTSATYTQVSRLIDVLPVFDMAGCPLQDWALQYPADYPIDQLWFDVAQKIAQYSVTHALMFFCRPKIQPNPSPDPDDTTPRPKIVYAQFKARRLTAADKKYALKKSKKDLQTAAIQEGYATAAMWQEMGFPTEGSA